MGCYYCKLANLDNPEVGVCKECNVEACPPRVNAHGDKCSRCGVFYCYQCYKIHAASHGLNVFQAFTNNANRVVSMVINWLQEVSSEGIQEITSERVIVTTDLGKFLSDWVEDEISKRDFYMLEQQIQTPKLYTLDYKQFSTNLLNRLRNKLHNMDIEIR